MSGGISIVSKRYARANNKYKDNYDSSKPNSFIMNLDANNLYRLAMNLPLPVREFQWVDHVDG